MELEKRLAVAEGDGLEFILSDGSRDRHGTRINPNGWDLADFQRNPVALFGHDSDFPIGRWDRVRVEGGKLIGTLRLASKGTSQRIDELIGLVEQGILRAVSVGFSIVKMGERSKSEWDIERQALHEVSLVSVGSNKNALAQARAMNISESTIRMAFGDHADAGLRGVTAGEHANPPKATSIHRNNQMDMTLSKRIEDAQTDLNAARDALTDHLADDAADTTQTEALASEIEAREERLASLKRAEKALGSATEERAQKPTAPALRKPLGVKLREPKPEDLIIRAAVVNALSFATGKDPIRVLEERYGDHAETNAVVRAAVAGATTTAAGWAAELVETATASFMESLRPISIYPKLAAKGISLSFGPNAGQIKLPSRAASPSISGSFVAEGSPIPVRRLGTTSITLSPRKMGVISVFSKEIAKYSNPQIEGLLRQEIMADTAITLDTLLLDSVASSTSRPAGLTNGVSALTPSAAGGYQAIIDDLQALAAPFDTANAGRALTLIMNPREARRLRMTPGPNAAGFGWSREFLDEFDVIVSTNVPAGNVYLIDAADFATAAGSAPEFEVSEHTVLHMEDTSPAHIAVAGTPNVVAAPAQSMFQTAQIALRMLMDVSWGMRRTGMVQWMDEVDWTPAA